MLEDREEPREPVQRVCAGLARREPLELVRRFDHGVGGTALVSCAGVPLVLKAWVSDDARQPPAALDRALELMELVRARGVVVPRLRARGELSGCSYLLYDYIDGQWPEQLTAAGLADLLAVVDAERDAAPSANPGWPGELEAMLTTGDVLFDIQPDRLGHHTEATEILTDARHRLAACVRSALRTSDVVHADFAPENVLVRRSRVVGVVDWERCRVGDAGLDLVGAIFDLELGQKTSADLRAAFWAETRARVACEVLSAYVGIYAVRYLSWAVDTDMEGDVLALVRRLLAMTAP